MAGIAIIILLVLFVYIVIDANIWNWKRRSGMTAEEKKLDDEETRNMRNPGDW